MLIIHSNEQMCLPVLASADTVAFVTPVFVIFFVLKMVACFFNQCSFIMFLMYSTNWKAFL